MLSCFVYDLQYKSLLTAEYKAVIFYTIYIFMYYLYYMILCITLSEDIP